MSKSYLRSGISVVLVCFLLSALILVPGVGAASESKETETNLTFDTDFTSADAEADVLTARAITIDEAKKEAQATVQEQLSIIAQQEEEEEETEADATVEDSSDDDAGSDTSSDSTASGNTGSSSSGASQSDNQSSVQASAAAGYLLGINNPDPNYIGYSINLSDADRDIAERIVMGEAGSMGFTGMALVAQCIRDTFVLGNYSSIADVIYSNGYYGSTSITPSSTCKEVINYIFDQGGSAVQHRIMLFYASNYCSSAWHESQNYVCSYGYVRFFDAW